MLDSLCRSMLWAQMQSTQAGGLLKLAYFLGALLLVLVLPLALGTMLARTLRMRGYEWRLGLILFTLTLGAWIVLRAYDFEKRKFRMPLGVDLKGGVILIYEVETGGAARGARTAEQHGEINMGDLTQALTNRINPSGTKEIVIRPYGERQVEIIIPEVDAEEVRNIKQQISTAGSLEFRIVANTRDHRGLIARAEEQSRDPDAARRISRRVMRGNELVGFWAEAAKEKMRPGELAGTILRNGTTGAMLDLQSLPPARDARQTLDKYLAENGLENVDVLVATDDGCDVTGDNLGMVAASVDRYLSPCVTFRLRGAGVGKFQRLTSSNLPDTDATPPFYRHLGIILDERLISFPRLQSTISDSGQITGNFSQQEVDFLVGILRAGKLPASLQKTPISENQIGSMLGDDTIQKGKMSIWISLVAVLIVTVIYYRFCGVVACGALLANLLFVFATMILLNAPLTLPGLAGLVLTVGMSIDANVLIYERMREELQQGAALRMAIRNGFDKAMSAIVDSNVTTIISAVVLYWIGTDQLRGFSVTLILGILMSMYTAVFCSRVVFDIVERRRWVTRIHMMQFLGVTRIDFVGQRVLCVGGSLAVILIGLAGVVVRGKTMFDIDFTGGVSVTMVLRDSMPPDEVRSRLDDHFHDASPPVKFSVNTVYVEGHPANSVYKIDADLSNTGALETAIETVFRTAEGQNLLLTYSMEYGDVKAVALAPAAAVPDGRAPPSTVAPAHADQPPDAAAAQPAVETPPPPAPGTPAADAAPAPAADAAPAPAETPEKTPPVEGARANRTPPPRDDLPSNHLLAWARADETPANPAPAAEAAASPPPAAADARGDQGAPVAPMPTAPAGPTEETRVVARLTFGDPINAPTLRDKIRQAYHAVHQSAAGGAAADQAGATAADNLMEVPGLLVAPDERFVADQTSGAPSKEWHVRMVGAVADLQAVLKRMQQVLESTPVLPSSSTVGGQVAGDTRNLALAALLASLGGIVAYVWIRFQHLIFGLAAIVALVHDVLVTLGAIALSTYLAKVFGFLLIEEFKINLTIIAALLTIIGYSLNDTIVVFDRIREVRGKSPTLTAEMINLSINQTLSRTLLTGTTTMIVVLILYAMGGAGVHGFAFTLFIGMVVGTYSSIYIASPILLFMFRQREQAAS